MANKFIAFVLQNDAWDAWLLYNPRKNLHGEIENKLVTFREMPLNINLNTFVKVAQ
jgi:hypothetical protein